MPLPLAGKRIVITRPQAQAAEFIDLLRGAGAVPIRFPTIGVVPVEANEALDRALRDIDKGPGRYNWVVFTSANGVRFVLDRMQQLGFPPSLLNQCRVAVIGPATAAALESNGIQVARQPEEYVAEAVFESLAAAEPLAGQRFLLLRADKARAVLHEQLAAHGALVDEIPVYHTVRGAPEPAAYGELRAGVDVITFTSSSTVHYFFDLLGAEALRVTQKALVACIGPVTAQTAREYGLHVDLVADEYTIPGLVTALTEKISL